MKKFDSQATSESNNFDLFGEFLDNTVAKEIVNVPSRVREIITKNMEDSDWIPDIADGYFQKVIATPIEEKLKEENKLLKAELDRMEQLLTKVLSERDDIALKYNDMSGRFESTLKTFHGSSGIGGDNSDSSEETETSGGSVSLLRQNAELRRSLNEEKLEFKRKLQAYQDSQQKNILLVEKLQAKVLQYKKRCNELEESTRNLDLQAASNQKPFLEMQRNHLEQSREFEHLLKRVDEEVHRANDLAQINEILKEQLEQSNTSNKFVSSENEMLLNLVKDLQKKQNECKQNKEISNWEINKKLFEAEDNLDLLCQKECERDAMLEIERLKAVILEKDHSINLLEMNVYFLENHLESLKKGKETLGKSEQNSCTELKHIRNRLSKSVDHLNSCERENDISKNNANDSFSRKSLHNICRSRSISSDRNHREHNRKNNKTISEKTTDFPLSFFQSAMHKKQMEVRDLKDKVLSLTNQNANLSMKLDKLVADNESTKRSLNVFQQENKNIPSNSAVLEGLLDQIKMNLNLSEIEVRRLETLKKRLMKQIDQSNEDNKQLLAFNGELERDKNSWKNEKLELIKEKEQLVKEQQRNLVSLEQYAEKNFKLKEELVDIKEQMHKTSLKYEILEQEKRELDNKLARNTQIRKNLEMNLGNFKHECTILKEALTRLHYVNEDVGSDNIGLNEHLKMLESGRSILMLEKSSLEEERDHMKEMIDELKSEKVDLLNNKLDLEHKNHILRELKMKMDSDFHLLNEQTKKNTDSLELVTQQKLDLAEECSAIKLEFEKQKEILSQHADEKEVLLKEKADLMMQISNLERDVEHLNKEAEGLKAERDASRLKCEKLNSEILDLEQKLSQFEEVNHEMELKIENLMDEIAQLTQEVSLSQEKNNRSQKLMEERLIDKEKHHLEVVEKLKSEINEMLDKASYEKNQIRENFEKEFNELNRRLKEDKNEVIVKLEREKEKLKEEVGTVKKFKEHQLMMAEQEKQKLISANEADRSKLMETILTQEKEALNIQNILGKLKNENSELEVKCHQNENTISQLGNELKLTKTIFDKARLAFEKDLERLNDHIEELTSLKKNLEHELTDLRMQLKSALETKDALRSELNEIRSNMTKVELDKEVVKRESLKLMTSLKEEQYENNLLVKMIDNLKSDIKGLEGEKLNFNKIVLDKNHEISGIKEEKMEALKDVYDLRESLKIFEETHLNLKKELQDIKLQLKSLEMEKLKLVHEASDNVSKLEKSSGKIEEMRKEIMFFKQKVKEIEDSKESLKEENNAMNRHLVELENETHYKNLEMKQFERDANKIVQMSEDRNKLEMSLNILKQEFSELNAKYKNSVADAKHLEEKTKALKSEKNDVETKLNSLLTTAFRSFAQGVPKIKARSRSSSKHGDNNSSGRTIGRKKRNRSLSPGHFDFLNINVEDVKIMMKEFAQIAAETARERDTAIAKLTDILMNHERLVSKFELLANSLDYSEREKKDLKDQVVLLQSEIVHCENSLKKEGENRRELSERSLHLENTLRSLNRERSQLQEKLFDMKKSEEKWEKEKHYLNGIVEDGEKKICSSESEKRVLEGELYRMKLTLSNKETENQVASNRMDQLLQQIEDLEMRTQSYKTAISRLNSDLIRCSEEKNNFKDQMNVLNVTLCDKSEAVNSIQEKFTQLQRTLSHKGQNLRMLQEALDDSRKSHEETKRQMQTLQMKMENMQLELEDKESRRVELEAQSKVLQHAHAKHVEQERHVKDEISLLQEENKNLQGAVVKLQRIITEMKADIVEAEVSAVRLKKDKTNLKKSLNKSEEFLNKTVVENSHMDKTLKKLEDDNFNLVRTVESLQIKLAKVEQDHRMRLIELAARQKEEREMELDKLFSAKVKAEKLLELEEKNHMLAVEDLGDQVSSLRERLNRELSHKRQFLGSGIGYFSDDLDSKQMPDKSHRGSSYNKVPKGSTSPAKVTPAIVTRHGSPAHQKKFIRSTYRK